MKKNKRPLVQRERYEKWIKTNEDWHPSYEPHKYCNALNHLALRVNFYELTDGTYRCCVWGADDTGMDFDRESREEVLEMFDLILDFTTMQELLDLGFIWA